MQVSVRPAVWKDDSNTRSGDETDRTCPTLAAVSWKRERNDSKPSFPFYHISTAHKQLCQVLVHVCVSHTHAGTCRTWTFGGKRGVGANQSICHHEERHTDTSSIITQAEIQQCLICVSNCLRQQKQYSWHND